MHYKTPRLLQMTTAQVAQSVEQRTENPRVGGSIPSLSTISKNLPLRKVFLCSDPIGPNISVLSGTGLALEPSCAAGALLPCLTRFTKMLQIKTNALFLLSHPYSHHFKKTFLKGRFFCAQILSDRTYRSSRGRASLWNLVALRALCFLA